MSETRPTYVRLPETTRRLLLRQAKREGKTMAQLIRQAIDLLLAKKGD